MESSPMFQCQELILQGKKMTENPRTYVAILADDMTGAMDSAAQFARYFGVVDVYTDSKYYIHGINYNDSKIISININTRSMEASSAKNIIYKVLNKLSREGRNLIIKKIDTALRGNIREETLCIMDIVKAKRVYIVPAYPKYDRLTIDGIQYYKDVPVDSSIFSKDTDFKLRSSSIIEIFHDINTAGFKGKDQKNLPTIYYVNAKTTGELNKTLNSILQHEKKWLSRYFLTQNTGANSQDVLFIGSLPIIKKIATSLRKVDYLTTGQKIEAGISEPILVVNGSNKKIARSQIEFLPGKYDFTVKYLQDSDFYNFSKSLNLISESLINKLISGKNIAVVRSIQGVLYDGLQELGRHCVSNFLAELIKRIFQEVIPKTLIVIGGETLYRICNALEIEKIEVTGSIDEVMPIGKIKTRDYGYISIVSKGGSVGTKRILSGVLEKVR